MSIDTKTLEQHPTPVDAPLSLGELAVLLVKHYGLTEGTFDLMLQYQIGTGAVGPDKNHLVPGVMMGVSQVGLIPSPKVGPNTVDASLINPTKSRAKSLHSRPRSRRTPNPFQSVNEDADDYDRKS